jgi:glycosidase
MRINSYLMNFNKKVINSMVNIISTHDTPRFLTLCNGDEKRFELAAVFQFTFPGVPLIYYGDEVGMQGDTDPDCRKPMVWDEEKWNIKLLKLYGFLIDIRKKNEALRLGEYRDLCIDGDEGILAYRREYGKNKIVVVMNTKEQNAEGTVELGNSFIDVKRMEALGERESAQVEGCRIKLGLKPLEWRIYKAVEE